MPSVKFVQSAEFHRLARGGRARGVGVRRAATVTPRALEDGSRKVRFCFSDGSVDRIGDTINPRGWETDAFMRNPVALWAHAADAPPIGRASDVGPEGTRLMGTIEFADPSIYAFADTIYKLVLGGFVNAVSVGFLPIEYSFVENDPARGWGIDFKRQELLEVSVVPVPANANALAEAQAKGIDLRPLSRWAERALARGTPMLSRSDLQRLREASSSSSVTELASHRVARDLVRAAQIRARLARTGPMRVHQWIPPDTARIQEEEDRRRRGAAYEQATWLSW